MASELTFYIFVVSPFVTVGIILVIFQQKFLKKYKEVTGDNDPLSLEGLKKAYEGEANFLDMYSKAAIAGFTKWTIYFKKYKNKELNDYAKLVRRLILIEIAILPVGFILMVWTAS